MLAAITPDATAAGALRRSSSVKRFSRSLTRTLRGLERDGLVTRTVYPSVPPRVDYALTDLGHSLLGSVLALERWAHAHRGDIVAARARYDSS
jgi:DNA-binding HxlR family transcriptional regulator